MLHIPNSAEGNCLTEKENHTPCLKSDIKPQIFELPKCNREKQSRFGPPCFCFFSKPLIGTSTGSEAFFFFICLDAHKFVSLSFLSLIKTIYPRVSTKPLPSDAKSPLPVDVRRSKTLLLKLPSIWFLTYCA